MAGVSAAGVSAAGFAPRLLAGPGAHRPVPLASVAKLMTAYVIVHDHPLDAGAEGPQIVVRPDEAAAYPAQARNGDSLVPVIAGEQISERQALVALLLPSADNMAWILARWDAGSQQAFVAKMNAAARRLGMTGTRYTDPSGLAASTVSTAADQVLLGRAVMAQPVLAGIAAARTAVVPVAGPVRNINRLLGTDQIVGLKTGSTTAAGGCVLLAAWHRVSGRRALIIAAVFGQPGPLSASLVNALVAGQKLVLALDYALDLRLLPHHRAGAGHGRAAHGQPAAPAHQHSVPADRSRAPRPARWRPRGRRPRQRPGLSAGDTDHRAEPAGARR